MKETPIDLFSRHVSELDAMLAKKKLPGVEHIAALDALGLDAHRQSVSLLGKLMRSVPFSVISKAAKIQKKSESLYALADAAKDPAVQAQLRTYGQALDQSKLVRGEVSRRYEKKPAAALAIGYPSAVDKLGAKALDKNPEVALKAVRALAKIRSKEADVHLSNAVMHNSTQVRSAAIDALIERKKI